MEHREHSTTLSVASNSPAQTEALGRRLGEVMISDIIVALKGELGAGKTTFTRGIAAGLDIAVRVTSPTFTLVNEYQSQASPHRLIHVDMYRLGEANADALDEAATIGISDLLDEIGTVEDAGVTVLVIEWAERIATLLPADHLEVRLDYAGHAVTARGRDIPADRRWITFVAHGPTSAAVVEALSSGNLFSYHPG